jgi:hypothetical protein
MINQSHRQKHQAMKGSAKVLTKGYQNYREKHFSLPRKVEDHQGKHQVTDGSTKSPKESQSH